MATGGLSAAPAPAMAAYSPGVLIGNWAEEALREEVAAGRAPRLAGLSAAPCSPRLFKQPQAERAG